MERKLLNEQETEQFGSELWQWLPEKCLVFLKGELGSGKTTLTRGVLRASGHNTAVKSPTYTLVEEYDTPVGKFYHFDLYRVKDPEELEWIGIRDYLFQQSICFIEWPELGKGYLPEPDLELTLRVKDEYRVIEIKILSDELQKKMNLTRKTTTY